MKADILETGQLRGRWTREALGALLERHGPMVLGTCLRILRDHHAAEDAAQAVFVALAKSPSDARHSDAAWLHEVARRTSLKALRSRRRREGHEREASFHQEGRQASRGEPDWKGQLDQALAALPEPIREAVVLRYLEGHPQAEAARQAGCPQGTLAWRASEGLSRLRSILGRQGWVVAPAALIAFLGGEAQAAAARGAEALSLGAAAAAGAGAGLAKAQGILSPLLGLKLKVWAAAALFGAALVPLAILAMSGAPQDPSSPAPRPAAPSWGTDYNVSLLTDQVPDLSDLDHYLASITSQWSTPQEKAVNIWRWSQRLRKQTSNPIEDGREVHDPILFFNSYGYCNCGIISGIDNALWLKMGWKAHYVQLGDHTVCEASWDNGATWHMFDNSMSIYCFNDSGQIASTREIEKNPRYYLENFAPECGTNPVTGLKDHQGWRSGSDRPVEYQRTLANGMDSFLAPNDVIEDHLAAESGRRHVLNIRPRESYTRYFKNLDAGHPDPRYYRPLRGKDVEEAGGRCIRASGVWLYEPDLGDPAAQDQVYSHSGVTWTREGARGPGSVVFKVNAAHVVCSARATLRGSGLSVLASRDAGITWSALGEGPEVDLSSAAAGQTEYLIKVELGTRPSALSGIKVETLTQINRPSLPRLSRGPNRVQLRSGEQTETIQFSPSLQKELYSKGLLEEKGLDVNDKPYFNVATLRVAAGGRQGQATWKIQAPTPIRGLCYGGNVCVKRSGDRAALLHSWDNRDYVQDFQKSDGAHPWDLVVNQAVEPGRIPPEAREVYLRYEFESAGRGGPWEAPGIQSARMEIRHEPRSREWIPLEVTYCWIEHREAGDVERRHTELVGRPNHEYTINVAGFRDPTLKWVRLHQRGQGPEGMGVRYGYSDGADVGPGSAATYERFVWGRNLARGRSYTLDGKQSPKNPDGGGDLTDGIIAPPDEYVSVKYMPTNVIFETDVSPVATIDLGAPQALSAVRVHAGQAADFHLAFPDRITVETSVDGRTYARAGMAEHHQVFNPPADYVPWELDESSQFDSLPAGGRLAYAYRILFEKPVQARYVRVTCACRKGWGVMLSEIQAFDRVTVDRAFPRLVSLPPIPPSKAPR